MLTIEVRDETKLEVLEQVVRTAAEAVAKGEKINFALSLTIGSSENWKTTNKFSNEMPVDFSGYSGDNLTREEKSSQLLLAIRTHFQLNMVQLAKYSNIPRSGLYMVTEGRTGLSEVRAMRLLKAFPATLKFKDEMLAVAGAKIYRKRKAK